MQSFIRRCFAVDNESRADKVDNERGDQIVYVKNDDVDDNPPMRKQRRSELLSDAQGHCIAYGCF